MEYLQPKVQLVLGHTQAEQWCAPPRTFGLALNIHLVFLTSIFVKPYCELVQNRIIGCIKGITTLDVLLVKDGGVLMPFVLLDGKWIGPTLEETSSSGVCRDWEDKADSDAWRPDKKPYSIVESIT